MKILHTISSGGVFGAEGVVLTLSQELKKNNIENIIININSTDKASAIVTKALELGLEAKDLFCKGKFDYQAIKELRKFILEQKIDIVHSHGYKSDFFTFFALIGLNVKKLATNHLWTNDTLSVRLYELIDGVILNFFNKIVGVSDRITNDLKRVIVKKNKLQTINNGINLDKFKPSPMDQINNLKQKFDVLQNAIIIGGIGRLTNQKDFSSLLESAKIIIKDCKNVYFLIVGDGPLRDDLQMQAKNLNINEKVIFAGIQTNMNLIYDLIDIFVISSIDEGLPLVLLEAMAKEKPIVTTDVGAIPNVINNNENGLLIPSRNVPALSDAIIELIKDKNKAKKLAMNARKTVEEKFSSEKMAKQYIAVYNEFAGRIPRSLPRG